MASFDGPVTWSWLAGWHDIGRATGRDGVEIPWLTARYGLGDSSDGAVEAQADNKAETSEADDERHDGVELEPDDHHHHGEDRHPGC